MRFGLIANLKRVGAIDAIGTFLSWAKGGKHELVLCEELREAVPEYDRFVDRSEIASETDMIVSMGGDGTLLATARAVGKTGTPILGVNIGSLGFLTQQTPDRLVHALDTIVKGEYRIEERMLLQASIEGQKDNDMPCALNDIVIDNGPVSRVMDISLRVNGEDVVTYIADGLILSTPTGSTAYSLAVGGPIVTPGMNAIISAAIAPFSLTTRPMIFSGDDSVELTVSAQGRQSAMTIDGQVMVDISDSDIIRINRADYYAHFVVFPENSYFKVLRGKLNWGIRPRG